MSFVKSNICKTEGLAYAIRHTAAAIGEHTVTVDDDDHRTLLIEPDNSVQRQRVLSTVNSAAVRCACIYIIMGLMPVQPRTFNYITSTKDLD